MKAQQTAEASSQPSIRLPSAPSKDESEALHLLDRTSRALRVARDLFVDFLDHQSEPAEGMKRLHERLGSLSPRSDGFFRKAFSVEGSAVQMPPELGPDDIKRLQKGKDTAAEVVAEVQHRWDDLRATPAEHSTSQLKKLYELQAFAECCVGNGPLAMEVSRGLLMALAEASEHAEAGYQLHRFLQRGGTLRPGHTEDKTIAHAAVQCFAGVEFIADDAERIEAMRSAGFCLSGAKVAVDTDKREAIELRLQELKRLLSIHSTSSVSFTDAGLGESCAEQDMARFIESITGKFAEAYKTKARKRLAEAYGPSAKDNRDTALQWLERFKLLAKSMGAARDAKTDDAECPARLKTAETKLRRIVGHHAAKERVLALYETYLRGLSFGGVLPIEGPPGNGKSSFAALCGEVFFGDDAHQRCRKQNLAALPLGTSPSGHGGQILDAQPSVFAEVLMRAGTGQVIFVLDEIEKASHLQDQLAAVLEPTDEYHDSYFNLPIDLSEALFICVYNDRSELSPHLRDRLDGAIVTRGLDSEQVKAVAAMKLKEAATKVGCPDMTFAPQVIDTMATKAATWQGDEQSGRIITKWSQMLALSMSSSLENPENVRHVDVNHFRRCVDGRWTEGHQPTLRGTRLWCTTLACKRFSEQLRDSTLAWEFQVGASTWEFHLTRNAVQLRLVEGYRQKAEFRCKVITTANGVTKTLANLPPHTALVNANEAIAWTRDEHPQAFWAMQQSSSDDTLGHALKCTISAEMPRWS